MSSVTTQLDRKATSVVGVHLLHECDRVLIIAGIDIVTLVNLFVATTEAGEIGVGLVSITKVGMHPVLDLANKLVVHV